MKCSNKRIFLPDQREQCTPAYMSFSTLSPSQLDTTPVIPEDLLPPTPLNLELLCKKREGPEDEDSARKLCDAILAGESLEELIPKIVSCSALSAAVRAAARGHVRALHALRLAGAALDAADTNMRTPLMHAVLELGDKDKKGKEKLVVRLLLSRGADASSVDEEGNAAVHWCAAAGAARALVQLLRAAPHATHARNAHADTPLHVAARQGHYACVVILLAQGARNSAGELPADVCTGACHSAISLNMQMTLAMGGHVPRRKLLCSDISNGREAFPIPCVNEVDDEPAPDEFTYVTQHVMPHHLHIDDTVETLQGCECKGGDCSAGAGGGECACVTLSVRRWYARGRLRADFPYHDPPMLFECNHTCACNLKKCANAVVTRARSLGATFVHTEVFRAGGARGLLLSRGADASSVDEEGNAAVHWCAAAGAARALVQLLRAAPHAAHARNAHADTPLHVAARQGHYACVVILLAQGARTDVENSAGELPADVCTGACHSAISLNMQMTLAMGGHVPRRRLLCSDISNGREAFPIPCVNEVDDEPAPDEFTYVTQHVMPHHLHIDDTVETLQGCECKGGDCSAGAGSGECACVTLSVRRWYARGRLRADFPYHDPPMLFECNHTCACNLKKCANAVVTRARSLGATFVHTEVFRAGGARGWGLRATRRVARGSPVAAYCGELLPAARADTRAADHYMFALDVKDDLLEQCVDKTQLCVDAAVYGSAARFMNHSCRPNVAPVRVFTACRDLRLPVVTLFATKDVQPGDELTFDYGDKFWSVKSKWMKCECGAPTCRYPVKADSEEAET
ncbi:hypothetical protein O3G_MSEX011561 [Manduca sexta]|uniref:SET domain-containing protein n=1 Tax=Manduca sexta TaxID=7130 RepID=A0A922CVT3_MANSE|nr:hypothetical protein O3G_MSEX011561 [Manduca sexta]